MSEREPTEAERLIHGVSERLKGAWPFALGVAVLAELAVEDHPYVDVAGLFGFGVWAGLGAGLAFVGAAWLLAQMIDRPGDME